MGSDITTILTFEGHKLSFIESETHGRLLRATDLCLPMEVGKSAISNQVSKLANEDRCSLKVNTPHGPQTIPYLTASGALQVMSTGRSRKCARLRKVVCDFFVRHNQVPIQSIVDFGRIESVLSQLIMVVSDQARTVNKLVEIVSQRVSDLDEMDRVELQVPTQPIGPNKDPKRTPHAGPRSYAKEIRRYRETEGLTYRQMAELTGVPMSNLQSWEVNEVKPFRHTIRKYQSFFDILEGYR